MVNSASQATNERFGETQRTDAWWVEPMLTVLGLGSFGIYTTWAAFQGANFEWGPYLSPLYSPLLQFSWMPSWFSPAFLILPFPLFFRATCYYYRKAYYRAFFADPPACAVGKPLPSGSLVSWKDLLFVWFRKLSGNPLPSDAYKGETTMPFVLQNLHRYAFYFAAIFVLILWYDAIKTFFHYDDKVWFGLGTVVMLVNCFFLSLYTFSCHSWRHIVGGARDCFSCHSMAKTQHKIWSRVSHLNENHMRWAWISLFTVWGTDIYIRLLASGILPGEPHIVLNWSLF